MNLINNPLIKIAGIVIIIYFALFHNTDRQDNLRNRLSPEKVSQNIDYIKDQITDAQIAINNAKIANAKKEKDAPKVKIGCNDVLRITYKKEYGEKVEIKTNEIFVVSSDKFSKKITGMSVGEEKEFTIKEKHEGKLIKTKYNVKIIKILEESNEKCSE